jgi:hypothetical protein
MGSWEENLKGVKMRKKKNGRKQMEFFFCGFF